MKKQLDVPSFPSGAESNGFVAALASVVCTVRQYTNDTPYWCSPKGTYCRHCGDCAGQSIAKHQESVYHALLTASGLAFTFDYPEDDSVERHTFPNAFVGWRWDEPFVKDILDFAGLSYRREANKTVSELYEPVKMQIDAGYPMMVANHRTLEGMSWVSCWKIILGYTENGILVLHHGGAVTEEIDGCYEDVILITGETACQQTYRDILHRIYLVLTDPSHDTLEREILNDLSHVTAENAAGLAYKMVGINSVPIESRWHAAEAFVSADNLFSALIGDAGAKSRLSDLFFSRYIANDHDETHGIGWKIWGCLNVGPETGYLPTEESFALIRKSEVQAELKRLFGIVFENDRVVAKGIKGCLETKGI